MDQISGAVVDVSAQKITLVCDQGRLLDPANGKCVESCTTGYLQLWRTCLRASACPSGYLLEKEAAKCVAECEAERGYFAESATACGLCSGFVQDGTCVEKCDSGKFSVGRACFTNCPSRMASDSAKMTCRPPESVADCTGRAFVRILTGPEQNFCADESGVQNVYFQTATGSYADACGEGFSVEEIQLATSSVSAEDS